MVKQASLRWEDGRWVGGGLFDESNFFSFVLLVGRRKWGEAQNELSPVGGWTVCLGCCCRVLLLLLVVGWAVHLVTGRSVLSAGR